MPTASRTVPDPASDAVPREGSPGPTDDGSPSVSDADGGRSEGLDRWTREIGRELFDRIGRERRPWRRSWWDDRFMALTLDDPMVRVQLFRFIDALPALKDAGSIRRHLAEYLDEAGDAVPWWLNLALEMAPEGTERAGWLAAAARTASGVMARKFIAGATPDEALRTVLSLRRRKLAFTADLLGEAIISEAEADWYQQTCLAMIDELTGPLSRAPEVPLIDCDQHGPIPRVNLSVKLSSLTAHFEPIHAEASIDHAAGRLRPILRAARDRGAYVRVPRLARRGDRGAGLPPRGRGRAADAPRLGRLTRGADHDPAGQGRVLGLRGLERSPAGLARAGLPGEMAERRVVRAVHAVPVATS
jgi:hypothetical protein